MHRIIRTALASLGAAAVISGGGLAMAYATTPAPTTTPASGSGDQVAALNKEADDLLAQITVVEKQLTSMPATASTPDPLSKQELDVKTVSTGASSTSGATYTPQPTVSTPTTRSDERDSSGGNDSDD